MRSQLRRHSAIVTSALCWALAASVTGPISCGIILGVESAQVRRVPAGGLHADISAAVDMAVTGVGVGLLLTLYTFVPLTGLLILWISMLRRVPALDANWLSAATGTLVLAGLAYGLMDLLSKWISGAGVYGTNIYGEPGPVTIPIIVATVAGLALPRALVRCLRPGRLA